MSPPSRHRAMAHALAACAACRLASPISASTRRAALGIAVPGPKIAFTPACLRGSA